MCVVYELRETNIVNVNEFKTVFYGCQIIIFLFRLKMYFKMFFSIISIFHLFSLCNGLKFSQECKVSPHSTPEIKVVM